ncbi:N-acetyltransferase [Rhodobacteraceae bacterium NNCM2]|nr:N-acetyltransferase [Coraliihabitans acroporae]
MSGTVTRETDAADLAEILALYPRAFPDEDLTPVVTALLGEGSAVRSLATFVEGALAAHALFTRCGTGGSDRGGALLGPLCVAPEMQRQGLGGALIGEGLARLAARGDRQVFVLGDPGYYRRFGFAPERLVEPPYALPADWREAWRSLSLNGEEPLAPGKLTLPSPWMQPALWGA